MSQRIRERVRAWSRHRSTPDLSISRPEAVLAPTSLGASGSGTEWIRAASAAVLLGLVTAVVYAPVRNHDLGIEVDDYIASNPDVGAGLSVRGVVGALTLVHGHNWHPVTWISHMADVTLYGLDPAGHHVTNVVLHVLNVVLLLLVLWSMTRRLAPSSFAAGLFALHPLHVESVCWLLERKDVLSTLFLFLTIWAYAFYARRPRFRRYLAALAAFALGLMSKPMLVTLPFVLLLLDLWPLGRIRKAESTRIVGTDEPASVARLLVEKVPFFVLSGVVSWVAYGAQGDAVAALQHLPLGPRIANALVSYVAYLRDMAWPAGLSFFYPFPDAIQIWQVTAAAALLAALSAFFVVAGRWRGYLAVGWLWYLGTLVPVIGLIQIGGQARADRYTYVPLVGLFIVVSWGVPDLLERWRFRRAVLGFLSIAVLVALAAVTRVQVGYWKDTITLLERSASVTPKSYFANYNLANHLKRAGRPEDAVDSYRRALEIRPGAVEAHYNLANTLKVLGRFEEAAEQYHRVLEADPDFAGALHGLGTVRLSRGRIQEAISLLGRSANLVPNGEVLNDLGIALLAAGRVDESVAVFREALRLEPDAVRHDGLGVALLEQGHVDEAIAHFRAALSLRPDYAKAASNLERARRLRAGS